MADSVTVASGNTHNGNLPDSISGGPRVRTSLVTVTVVALVLSLLAVLARRGGVSSVSSQAPIDHVVYFKVTPGSETLTPSALGSAFTGLGYTYAEVTSWAAVLSAHYSEPIDVLIVDAGSYSLIDQPWTAANYYAGMMVAGINIGALHLEAILGDPRIGDEFAPGALMPWTGEYFSAAAYILRGSPGGLTAVASNPTGIASDPTLLPTQETLDEYFSVTEHESTAPHPYDPLIDIDSTYMFYKAIEHTIDIKNGEHD